jgi:signal transduction histidine kinase
MHIELWEDLPWIAVDPSQIKQVLLNLVHNAIQAMPRGGKLTVKTSPVERQGREWLSISVADTGFGISTENLERIFEPFFTTRPAGQGTGLGLSVSYGIITEHSGYIEVESRPGQGSCFNIFLPVDGEQDGD